MTVSFNGVVVVQKVYWRQPLGVVIGGGADAVPTPDDRPLARARWLGAGEVHILPLCPGAPEGTLRGGEHLCWTGGAGVDVRLDLVPRIVARRRGRHTGGDVALLVFVMTLLVGVAQARIIGNMFGGGGSGGVYSDPSPELIARLLKQEFAGAEDGELEIEDRDVDDQPSQHAWVPAGQLGGAGPAGGGHEIALEVVRAPSEPDAQDQPLELAHAADVPLDGERLQPILSDVPTPAPELLAETSRPQEAGGSSPTPLELLAGWGFHDWIAQGADPKTAARVRRNLEAVREVLAIDPDNPHALTMLGNYAFLAENLELSRAANERLIALMPDEPAGYNNLALSYKRTGEFHAEEALYRQALSLDPADVHVLNNLAVNLAHQRRFDEALEIMETLEELDPESPYAELHRAKIYAAMGRRERTYRHLRRALDGVQGLDTLHHIEFRQDLRLDPVFDPFRTDGRFRRLLQRYYGDDALGILAPRGDRRAGSGRAGDG